MKCLLLTWRLSGSHVMRDSNTHLDDSRRQYFLFTLMTYTLYYIDYLPRLHIPNPWFGKTVVPLCDLS
jgi:hypothetical protein